MGREQYWQSSSITMLRQRHPRGIGAIFSDPSSKKSGYTQLNIRSIPLKDVSGWTGLPHKGGEATQAQEVCKQSLSLAGAIAIFYGRLEPRGNDHSVRLPPTVRRKETDFTQ